MCVLSVWLHGMDRDSFIMFTHRSDILEFWHFGRGELQDKSLLFLAWISLFVMLTGELMLCCEVTVAELLTCHVAVHGCSI